MTTTPKGGRQRQRAIHVCLSAGEYRDLVELVNDRGLSVSTWVRLQIRDEWGRLAKRRREEAAPFSPVVKP